MFWSLCPVSDFQLDGQTTAETTDAMRRWREDKHWWLLGEAEGLIDSVCVCAHAVCLCEETVCVACVCTADSDRHITRSNTSFCYFLLLNICWFTVRKTNQPVGYEKRKSQHEQTKFPNISCGNAAAPSWRSDRSTLAVWNVLLWLDDCGELSSSAVFVFQHSFILN